MVNKRANSAVSEVIGTAILLGMAIALFSVVQVIALDYPFNSPSPSVQLVGTIDENTILIKHQGGESLSLDTKIMFTIDGEPEPIQIASDILDPITSNGDDFWNIGEKVSYTFDNIDRQVEATVEATVIDIESNSIIMRGVFHMGSS